MCRTAEPWPALAPAPQQALQQAFQHLSQVLQRRHRGLPAPGIEDWIDPAAVASVALLLPTGPQAAPLHWELRLALRPGIPARALPRQLRLGPHHPPLALRCLPAPPARAQAVPEIERSAPPLERGTATCLLRDRLNLDRYYLLSCGHVLAPTDAARWDDPVLVLAGGQRLQGRLREWQPSVGIGVPPSTIDAGLVELDSATMLALRGETNDWLPTGLSDEVRRDLPIRLRRADGPLPGSLKVHWSGQVSVPDGDDFPDYFLHDAVGYTTPEPTRPGDSGAAVWTEADALLGMHIGSIAPEAAYGANAVLGRIAPVLDWYCVKPFTRDDPATLGVDDRPGTAPRLPLPPAGLLLQPGADDLTVMARTLWGEARGEGVEGMQAVASVIRNRMRRGYRGKHTASEVCLDPFQFSCWNEGDANRRRLDRIDREPDAAYLQARDVATQVLAGGLPDSTRGALHYVAATLRRRPHWLDGQTPCAVIGNHEFYNSVA